MLAFYSLPILSGILPTPYYLHYCALVCAIAILLGDHILERDLEKAQVLLEEFYQHAPLFYSQCCFQIQYFVEVRDGERESVLAVLHIRDLEKAQVLLAEFYQHAPLFYG